MTLDLFSPEPCSNLLPYEGEVQDYGCILSTEEAEQYFHYLYQHLAWRHDEAKLYGKHFITPARLLGMEMSIIDINILVSFVILCRGTEHLPS